MNRKNRFGLIVRRSQPRLLSVELLEDRRLLSGGLGSLLTNPSPAALVSNSAPALVSQDLANSISNAATVASSSPASTLVNDPLVQNLVQTVSNSPLVQDVVKTVVNNPVVTELVNSPVVQQVVHDVLDNPVVGNVVHDVVSLPIVSGVVNSPVITDVVKDVVNLPVVQNVVTSPVVQEVVGSPAVQEVLSSPAVHTVVQTVVTSPVVQQVGSIPAVQNLVQEVVQSPVGQVVVHTPAFQNLSDNAAVQALIGSIGIGSDPAPEPGVLIDRTALVGQVETSQLPAVSNAEIELRHAVDPLIFSDQSSSDLTALFDPLNDPAADHLSLGLLFAVLPNRTDEGTGRTDAAINPLTVDIQSQALLAAAAPAMVVVDQGESASEAKALALHPSDVLAQAAPFDVASLESAVQQFLAQLEALRQDLSSLVTGMGVYPWIIAMALAAAGYEIRRRRRKMAQADVTLAMACEIAAAPWLPEWAGVSPVDES